MRFPAGMSGARGGHRLCLVVVGLQTTPLLFPGHFISRPLKRLPSQRQRETEARDQGVPYGSLRGLQQDPGATRDGSWGAPPGRAGLHTGVNASLLCI